MALYTLEINGEHASAFWDLHDLHGIQYFDHHDEGRTRGWRSIRVTNAVLKSAKTRQWESVSQ